MEMKALMSMPRISGRVGWIILLAVLFTTAAAGQIPPLQMPGQTPSLPPAAATTAERVKVELVAQFDPAPIGQRFALAVVLDVQPPWHLYANPKQGELGLDTEIIAQPAANLRFGPPIYPPGRKYYDELLKTSNHIYEGKTVCHLPVEIAPEASAAVKIDLLLKGLLCSDEGTCIPWEKTVSAVLKVAQSPTATGAVNRPELFVGIDLAASQQRAPTAAAPDAAIASDDWLKPIFLALVAGLLMNLMPCVLPIIPIVIMTLMKQCVPTEGAPDRTKSIKVGLAFAAGIMIVFVGLAVVMSVFKLISGEQFQSSTFKFILLMIVYVLSLSMFGLFEIALPARLSNMTVVRKGYLGALGMGMLATVLATPCGAPLLTPVVAWSLSKPLAVMIAVFLVVGAGMACPYVLLTSFPGLLNRIPKGGNWMIRLKQVIGFAMLAFAVNLIMLFPAPWHGPLLYFCLLVGFCVWLGLSVGNFAAPPKKRYWARGVALVLLIAAVFVFTGSIRDSQATDASENWLTQLENYQQQGQTVMVKFTANWCKNCAVLDKIIYKRQVFQDKLAQTNTTLVIADWSYEDRTIKQMLLQLGGPGQALPFAAVFPRGDRENPILLRDFYSLQEALAALDQAVR